mmetsp:Transcript_46460/g.145380  ORF Transcript_46460/g.145380 Transcript_46460/m.145380 type:complete len:255 (-) Transcript_46460:593-1357(-)
MISHRRRRLKQPETVHISRPGPTGTGGTIHYSNKNKSHMIRTITSQLLSGSGSAPPELGQDLLPLCLEVGEELRVLLLAALARRLLDHEHGAVEAHGLDEGGGDELHDAVLHEAAGDAPDDGVEVVGVGDLVLAEGLEGALHDAVGRRRVERRLRGRVQARAADVVGVDAEHLDAERGVLAADAAAKLRDEGLGGAVGGEEGRGLCARAAAHVDDGALAAVGHEREQRARHLHRGAAVHLDHVVGVLQRQLLHE